MKAIVILFLSAVLCDTFAEPLKYRQTQQLQAESEASEDQDAQNDDENPEHGITEPTLYQRAPAPYPPTGWLPISSLTNGQLLVLPPVAVRDNLELITFDNFEAAKKTSTAIPQDASEQAEELETIEPKTKTLAAHKRPGPTIIIIKGKKVGELKAEAKPEESTEANENGTETSDKEAEDEAKQTTNAQLPSAEPAGYFVQLPDGSFQRIVAFVTPQERPQAALVSQPTNVPFRQLYQATSNPFGYNPITNPKIVTFSAQYNAK